jgi:hypothetical protein
MADLAEIAIKELWKLIFAQILLRELYLYRSRAFP